jgi:hypothetical protein
VYVDGKLVKTLRGDAIVAEFIGMSINTSQRITPELDILRSSMSAKPSITEIELASDDAAAPAAGFKIQPTPRRSPDTDGRCLELKHHRPHQ